MTDKPTPGSAASPECSWLCLTCLPVRLRYAWDRFQWRRSTAPAISKVERQLIRVLERKGKRGFLYGKSLERPLVRYRRHK